MTEPYYQDDWLTVYHGDARTVLAGLAAESVNCVVTSPPYWGLRDYGEPGQLGLEPTPEAYVAALVDVFREVRRVLRSDGTVWLNLGDSYASSPAGNTSWSHGDIFDGRNMDGHHTARRSSTVVGSLKPKDLVGIPWMVAFALRADGWYLRSDIIWSKPNPMPESVTDRPTKSHEYLFLLARSPRYYFDADAVRERAEATPQRRLTPVSEQPGAKARLAHGGHNPQSQGGAPTKRDGRRLLAEGIPFGMTDEWVERIRAIESEVDAEGELGRNIRSVWTVATQPYPGAHFATFPPKLIEPAILAGCPEGGTVLDPFAGSGTTGLVAPQPPRGPHRPLDGLPRSAHGPEPRHPARLRNGMTGGPE